ncbi:hypothetical protein HanIR_Chr14g0676821 [Helianthus annuus]|nr:hypothetical protein HanIR_Chr14g0676821 [Helianthus annuus]
MSGSGGREQWVCVGLTSDRREAAAGAPHVTGDKGGRGRWLSLPADASMPEHRLSSCRRFRSPELELERDREPGGGWYG